MASGRGSLMLDGGESREVRYSMEQIVERGGITIVGEIHDLPGDYHWLGLAAVLTLNDGRRLRIIFDEPPRFRAAGGYF